MVFSSTIFLFVYLPISLLGYYLFRGKFKNYWLLLVSLIFFGWSQPKYIWIIIASIVINYLCALLVDKLKSLRKSVLFLGVLANLSLLFYFKYFDFVINCINSITKSSFSLKNIVLPIGISFFTFQGMSYLIDVYRKDVPVQKNIFKVALYIVLFPQLIAGPIVRYVDIATEIDERKETVSDFCAGIERFIVGLAKKAIIANTMAAMVDAIWKNGASGNTWIVSWAGSIGYTLQIYYDFSGYSDMAIGLGRMFGFHINENFKLPYISNNITEFWRRWHISLSSWFRDYVYIPLGGNRKNVYLNLAIVFLLTGIWHGASWHFIVWGVWNGLFILAERIISNLAKKKDNGQIKNLFKTVIGKIYTLFVINLGWIIFRAPHTKDALLYIATMFGVIVPDKPGFTLFWYLDRWTITVMVIGIVFASSFPTKILGILKDNLPNKFFIVAKYTLLILVFYLAILRIVSGTYNPFIYFQF